MEEDVARLVHLLGRMRDGLVEERKREGGASSSAAFVCVGGDRMVAKGIGKGKGKRLFGWVEGDGLIRSRGGIEGRDVRSL